jgi:zinc transport system substrate-binding protein
MKRAPVWILRVMFCLIAFTSFPSMAFTQTGPLEVAVSILPQKYFAEKIGGNHVSVTVMVPPGADPHVYEPRPRQIIELSRSKLYFSIGVPFENAWLTRFKSANTKLVFVQTDRGIVKIPLSATESHSHNSHDSQEGGLDPHIWLSPPLVKTIALTMRDALVLADPAHAADYRANSDAFLKEIEALDRYLRTQFSTGGDRRRFMVFHPAWGYFAETYHLAQIPVEIDGKEPKPSEIVQLIKMARKEGITAVFVQPQFSARTAKTIAGDIGGKLIIADDLAEDWDHNLRAVAEAFKTALR